MSPRPLSRTMPRSACAFALSELLIIVVVLGLVAAIAVPKLAGASTPTPRDLLESQLETLETQLQLFRSRHGRFPTIEEMQKPPADTTRGRGFGVLIDEGYLTVAPINPRTRGGVVGRDWIYDPSSGRVWPVRP